MKILLRILKTMLVASFFILCYQPCHAQFLKRLKEKVKHTAEDHITNDVGNATNNTIDKAEHPNIHSNNNNNGTNNSSDNSNNNVASNNNTHAVPAVPTLTTYKNYDFVPGDSIIFADDFSDDEVGELPAHWLLCYGQGQVNEFDGKKVFMCTAGSHGDGATVLEPRMKKKSGYMPKAFTVEFDMYCGYTKGDGFDAAWAGLNFYGNENNPDAPFDGYSDFDMDITHFGFYTRKVYGEGGSDLPKNIGGLNFVNKWHHVAIAYRDGQMKIYLDQNRVYVVPQVKDTDFNKFGIRVGGKCVVTNIRLAAGGGMTMLKKKFTDAKIITHGITFDIDKDDLKPESMGTLNMIFKIMKYNPDLKFEIDGHTDNTGEAAHNLTLSQQRADAVKAQLVKMGIDASRLTTKGFGDTVPIADNSTPDGRANNRRVEFVRMK